MFSVSSNWTVKYLVHFNPIATAQSVAKKPVEEIKQFKKYLINPKYGKKSRPVYTTLKTQFARLYLALCFLPNYRTDFINRTILKRHLTTQEHTGFSNTDGTGVQVSYHLHGLLLFYLSTVSESLNNLHPYM